jgi:hypothetical protein
MEGFIISGIVVSELLSSAIKDSGLRITYTKGAFRTAFLHLQ